MNEDGAALLGLGKGGGDVLFGHAQPHALDVGGALEDDVRA